MVGSGPDPHMRGRLHRQGALCRAGRGPIPGGQGKAGNQALAGSRRPWHAHRGCDRPGQPPRLAPAGRGAGNRTRPIRLRYPRAHHHPPGSGYDSAATRRLLEVLGCDHVISRKGEPLQAGARWLVERTNSWHNRGFKKLAVCTQRSTAVLQAYIALANTIILIRSLILSSWTSHRWPTRPTLKP